MNRLTTTFLILITVCVVVIGWSASLTNEYNAYLPGMEPEGYSEYYWEYVIAQLVLGVIVFVIVWPFSTPKFYRWLISFFVLVGSAIYLLLTAMHSPPAHIHLFYVALTGSLLALFMSGYALGVAKQNA